MTTLDIGPEDFSNSEIIRRCLDPNCQFVGGVQYGNRVVKLSEKIAVKFGWGLTVEEADNQRKAFELLDRKIVRVPQVYRYFTQPIEETQLFTQSVEGIQLVEGFLPRGFIVMEYVHGDMIKSPNNSQSNQIARVLSYFASIHGRHPGPLQSGVSRGLLWEENGKPAFKSIQQMERWLNVRLPDVDTKLTLQKYPLVLCHLDLAPRNILWLNDGSICFLDWESAGFYPRFFEVCLLKIKEGSCKDYVATLMKRMKPLTDEEEAQMLLLIRSFYNGIKYSFVSLLLFFLLCLEC